MFVGHFGVAFAGKKIDNTPSLGTYMLASQFIDLLWPFLLIFGIEHVEIDPGNTVVTPLNFTDYPFSHSMVGVLFWGILFGAVYYIYKKNITASILLGSLVFSHWILDLVTHRPDLPILPWSDFKMGFGLWDWLGGTLVVEGGIFALGVFIYSTSTRHINKTGLYALIGFVVFITVIYLANIFGPPPPSTEAIGYAGLLQWLFVFWGYWIDRNRESTHELLFREDS